MGPLELYKRFVREHSALVVNLERLAHWFAWSPERFGSDGARSEFAYEAWNAGVGLLGLYNESIMSGESCAAEGTDWGFLLAAVEQVQTLVELRAMQLEARGKMSRYGPLIALEALKLAMRLRMWAGCKSRLALEGASGEDTEQFESEARLRELLGALVRLRRRYDPPPPGGTGEGGCAGDDGKAVGGGWYGEEGGGGGGEGGAAAAHDYNARQAAAAAVRAAAIAPGRPPCACGSSGAALGGGGGSGGGSFGGGGGGGGAPGMSPVSSAGALGGPQLGAYSSGGGAALPPLPPAAAEPAAAAASAERGPEDVGAAAASSSGPRVHSPFRWGWWGRSAAPPDAPSQPAGDEGGDGGGAAAGASGAGPHSSGGGSSGGGGGSFAGALPGSWGPPSRPPPPPPVGAGWRWRRGGGAGAGGAPGGGGGGGGCSRLEEKLLERQAGWRLDPSGMDAGDRVIWLGELAYLARPLIYVILLKRHGLRSWKPWAASLGLELLSQYALSSGHALLQAGGARRWPPGSTLYSLALLRGLTARKWAPTEQQELLARRLGLLRYLLRSPCYDAVTRPAFSRAARGVGWLPLLGPLAGYALELVDSMQGYYTYIES
ncbi:MAG: hypothetical protein J3K34DRAFT_516939 [Monoraphidium minutum]|nr:MAG: hypothetical protein J3K34DRAFT_516939 [Monoraphidium minutum]